MQQHYRDVSMHSANYVKSIARCRYPRSSHWWSRGGLRKRRADVSSGLVRHLQSVLNAATRLIYHAVACLHGCSSQSGSNKVVVLTIQSFTPKCAVAVCTSHFCYDLPGRFITLLWHLSFGGATFQTFNSQ